MRSASGFDNVHNSDCLFATQANKAKHHQHSLNIRIWEQILKKELANLTEIG